MRHSSLTAFDVEDPNWHRARHWGEAKVASSRAALGFRLRAGRDTDRVYRWDPDTDTDARRLGALGGGGVHPSNELYYVEADALLPDGWAELARVRRERGLGAFHLDHHTCTPLCTEAATP